MSLRIALCALALFVPLAPSVVRACSASPCEVPVARPVSVSIPANAGGVWLNPGYRSSQTSYEAVLRLTDGAMTTTLDHEAIDRSVIGSRRFALRTTAPWTVGATLSLDVRSDCDYSDPDAGPTGTTPLDSWTITDAVAKPTALGTLTSVSGSSAEAGRTPGGASCYETFAAAYADISLAVDASASPWLDAMVFETVVNGNVYRPGVTSVGWNQADFGETWGGSWIGRGQDRIFVACSGDLSPRTVSMRGILPDGTVLETPAIEVTLACSEETLNADAGVDAGNGGAASGGSCHAAPHTRTRFGVAFLVALGVLVQVRRRAVHARAK